MQPVIRINKGQPPQKAQEKGAELIKSMKVLYSALLQLYHDKKKHNAPVVLTDDDLDNLALVSAGQKSMTKKQLAAERKKVESIHFGEEIIERVPTSIDVFTDSTVEALRDPFKKTEALFQAYQAKKKAVYEEWLPDFPQIDEREKWAKSMYRAIRLAFQERRIAGTLQTAPLPQEFLAIGTSWADKALSKGATSEREVWAKVCAAQAQRYLNLIHAEYLSYGMTPSPENDLLKSLIGYSASVSHAPTLDLLFEFYKKRTLQKATEHKSITALTDEEIAGMSREETYRPDLGYYILAGRIFRDLLDLIPMPKAVTDTRPMIGWGSDHFSSEYYAGGGFKEALLNTHYGKCAYCEAKVRSIAHGDVEHFRPKAGYEQGHVFNRGGYFWQAYEWENLFYSCQVCNQVYKGNLFPVLLDDKFQLIRYGIDLDISKEQPAFINMEAEEPRGFIRFNPIDGLAYPWDVVNFFYKQQPPSDSRWEGDVEKFIYRVPEYIPQFQRPEVFRYNQTSQKFECKEDPTAGSVYSSQAPGNFWDCLAQAPFSHQRGLLNIIYLGLNRKELVLARVSRLRHLRGLLWATRNGYEKDRAIEALAKAMGPAAEFSSLAIDAIHTWQMEAIEIEKRASLQVSNSIQVDLTSDPWIERYNKILAAEPNYEAGDDFEIKDQSVMYFIAVQELANAGKARLLTYITASEELEDFVKANKIPGWYLAIPEEDGDVKVTLEKERKRRGKTIVEAEETTMKELLADLKWQDFKNSKVYATGPFSSKFSG